MTYDIEAAKRESREFKAFLSELFPLADERDFPLSVANLAEFLRKRISFEVEQRTFHFTSRVCRILCEVSPPKTHVDDMARIVVNKAKQAGELEEQVRKLRAHNDSLEKEIQRLKERVE